MAEAPSDQKSDTSKTETPSASFDVKGSPGKSLEQYIADALSSLSANASSKLTVGVLKTTPFAWPGLFFRQANRKSNQGSKDGDQPTVTRIDRIMYVCHEAGSTSGADKADAESSDPRRSLMAALLVSEYMAGTTLIVNIEKVDTSGAGVAVSAPAGLVASTVRAYIAYLVDQAAHTAAPHEITCVQVHVFGRSQSQYLFHRSSERAGKRVLGDSALVGWWMRVLGAGLDNSLMPATTGQPSVSGQPVRIERQWFVPGETAASAQCKSLLRAAGAGVGGNGNGPSATWDWGIGSVLVPEGSDVGGGVPMFPDDPLAKAAAMVGGDEPQRLMETLAIVGECQRVCALLCVRISVPERPTALEALHAHPDDKGIARSEFDAFMRDWMACEFDSGGACEASSGRLVDAMMRRFGAAVGLAHAHVAASSSASVASAASAGAEAPVRSVQSLVRKRPAAPICAQSLVKHSKVE